MAFLTLIVWGTGIWVAGSTGAATSGIGDLLVGPETAGTEGVEPEHMDLGTADLDALWSFIQNRETAFREKQSQKMAEAGILTENQSFLYADGFQDMSRQILAMTAVCRDYTFYNRIVCQWYADHLWDETYTYQVIGTKYQEKAVEQLLPMTGAAADFLGLSGASFADAVEHAGNVLDGKCKVAVVLKNRSREEIYDMDSYRFPIPVEWEGWGSEKRAECDALMELDDADFRKELEARQAASLLPTPVPFYKQGAAERGQNPSEMGHLPVMPAVRQPLPWCFLISRGKGSLPRRWRGDMIRMPTGTGNRVPMGERCVRLRRQITVFRWRQIRPPFPERKF